MQLGTTFSHRHLKYLGCSVPKALDYALDMGFSHLRLCSYWDEIEVSENHYDFSELEKIIKSCQKHQQKVVLTLGIKAPRWPEYYFPSWLTNHDLENPQTQEKILNFVEQTLQQFKKYSCITHFQIENEALDPSGPDNLKIPLSLLDQEIALVRKLTKKKIILSLWGNTISQRKLLPSIAKKTDIVGLDLYYRQCLSKILGKNIYIGPLDSQKKLTSLLKKTKKETWIMELQAEPWESNHQEYLADNPASISPEKIEEFYAKASELPVSTIFFWGFEYWYYRAEKKNDPRYLETIQKLIKANQ